MKSFSLKKCLFVLSIIIAFLFLVVSLGKKFESPFKLGIKALNVLSYYENSNNETLILNEYGTRISFLDKDKKITKNIDFDDSAPISNILGFIEYDNSYYLYGSKYERDSIIITNDRVVKYSLDFKKYEIVFDDVRKEKNGSEQIFDIYIKDGKLYICEKIYQRENADSIAYVFCVDLKTKEIKKIHEFNDEYIYDFKYMPESDSTFILKYFENFKVAGKSEYKYTNFLNKHSISNINIIDEENIVWHDFNEKNVYLNDKILLNDVYKIGGKNSGNNIIYLSNDYSKMGVYDISTNHHDEYTKFDYSLSLVIFKWIKCLCLAYMLGLIIVLITKSIIKLYKDKKYEILKNIFVISIMTIIVFYISSFYIKYNFDNNIKYVKNEIDNLSGFLLRTIDDGLIDTNSLLPKSENSDEYRRCFDICDKTFGGWISEEIEDGEYPYIVIFKKSGDYIVSVYDSTYADIIGAKYKINDDLINRINSDDVDVLEISTENLLCKFMPIYDVSGELSGVLEIGYSYDIFLKQQFTNCIELSIEILIFLTILYILYKEIVSFYKGYKKQHDENDNEKKVFGMIHSIAFFYHIGGALDEIILILISKEMLEANGVPDSKILFLMTLPALLIGIGRLFSSAIYIFYAKKRSLKSLLVKSSILITICLVIVVFIVYKRMFILFCIAMLVLSVLREIIYFCIYYLPLCADNEVERINAFQNIHSGAISATIIGTLIGGFIVQSFGNTSLYVVALILSIPEIFLFCFYVPKTIHFTSQDEAVDKKVNFKNIFKFIFSPSMIGYCLLLLLPIFVMGGYKSFLFPLSISELSWPKDYITNFYVLVRVITLVIIDFIINYTKKMKQWNVVVCGLLFVGAAFMCCYINETVVMAIVLLLVQSIFSEAMAISKESLWVNPAKYYNVDEASASQTLLLIENLFNSLDEVILAMFIMIAGSKANALLGVFCVLCGILFAILTRKSLLRKR